MTSGFLNHTLKNEISKIAIIADNIKYASSKQESDECVQIIKESTTQMMEMIKRINQQIQDVLLKETECCLNDIIESAVKSASIHIGNNNIEIVKEYEKEVSIICDNVHIKEVLVNVLKNAIEAQGNSGKIHIRLYGNKNYVVVEVRDTGCGISKDEISHITEPFWSKKSDIKSMGLGLAYCNRIMHYYGSLEVYSELNKGTTIYLNFSSKKLSAK
jgi:signal transduction histidine kinase